MTVADEDSFDERVEELPGWTVGSDHSGFNFGPGRYDITAQGFSGDNRSGTPGQSSTVTVEFIDDSPAEQNNPPSAQDDILHIVADGNSHTLPVLDNDSDSDGDTLILVAATASAGEANIASGSELLFTPPAQFTGTVTINYTISDGIEEASAKATVSIQGDELSLTLSWSPPTQRQDGSALTPSEIQRYEVRYTRVGDERNFFHSVKTTHARLEDLLPGTYRLSVQAVDSAGLRSHFSDPVTYDLSAE